MRLNKFLALAMGVSRRQADDLISNGEVTLNGEVAILGARVSESDVVAHKGESLEAAEYTYMMLNKPVGYVCSKKRQGDTPTIYELLPENMQTLKTVGRLDKDSSGLILLSNDGDFTHVMTHPSHQKEKIYYAETMQKISEAELVDLNSGVQLEDGISRLNVTPEAKGYTVKMSEGRNRQIRRTFSAMGKEVTRLHRLSMGDYSLDGLGDGEIKQVQKLTS